MSDEPAIPTLSSGMVIPPPPGALAETKAAPKPAPAHKPAPQKVTRAKAEMNQAGARMAAKKAEKAAKKNKPVAQKAAKPAKAEKPVKALKPGKKAVTGKTFKPAPTPKGGAKALDGAICTVCHKPLSRHTSVSRGMGDVCEGHIKALPAGVSMEQHYEKIQLKEIPDGWIPLSKAIATANSRGVSTYRFIQVIGGDRMIRKPFNKAFQVKFYKNIRYISKECVSKENLDAIRKV